MYGVQGMYQVKYQNNNNTTENIYVHISAD